MALIPGQIKDFKSTLQILEGQDMVKESVVEVNHPLTYGGYSLYQATYDRDREQWSGSEVAKAPGVPLVYGGFTLFLVGLVLALYIQPSRQRTRATQSEPGPGK